MLGQKLNTQVLSCEFFPETFLKNFSGSAKHMHFGLPRKTGFYLVFMPQLLKAKKHLSVVYSLSLATTQTLCSFSLNWFFYMYKLLKSFQICSFELYYSYPELNPSSPTALLGSKYFKSGFQSGSAMNRSGSLRTYIIYRKIAYLFQPVSDDRC